MNCLLAEMPMVFQRSWISRAPLTTKITWAFALLIPIAALGQGPERSLSGKVKSASGSPIPNAQVFVKNLASGNTLNGRSASDLAALEPGVETAATRALDRERARGQRRQPSN